MSSILSNLASSAATCFAVGSDGSVSTQPFLATCNFVLPVLGTVCVVVMSNSMYTSDSTLTTEQLGTGMALVKNDVGGNINRLQQRYATDPNRFTLLDAIVQQEVAGGVHTQSSSCTKGLLWLKR